MKAEEDEGLDLHAASNDTEGELSISGIAIALFDAHGRLLAARWEGLEPMPQTTTDWLGIPQTIRVRNAEWRRLLTRHTHKDRSTWC